MKKNGKNDTDRITHKVAAHQIKPGEIMAFVYFVKVKSVAPDFLSVKTVDALDMDFDVNGRPLIENGLSADQWQEEIQVSKTRAAEILVSSFNRPLTVCFEKADGKERVLRGKLVTPEPLLGRSMMEDFDLTGDRLRLVDHRTIKYIIVEGVKYSVKTHDR